MEKANNYDHLEVRESLFSEKGIFTKKDIKKDAVIYAIEGVLMTLDEIDKEGLSSSVTANACRFSETMYISPKGTLGDFQNHSCVPNAYVYKENETLFIKAIDTIKADSEIVIDYSTIMVVDDEWVMKCRCGQSGCRRIIERFVMLPEKTRREYLDRGIVPEYIISIDS